MSDTTESSILALVGEGYKVRLKGSAIELKAELIGRALEIDSISSDADVQKARTLLRDLTSFRTQLDAARKAVKAPAMLFGKMVDEKSAQFGEACVAEERRITSAIQLFAAEQERVRREAAEKQRREAAEAARKAQEAQRAAEEAQRQQQAATIKERQQQEAARLQAAREAAAAEAQAKAAEEASLFAAPATAGTKVALDYEIEDLHRLYSIAPGLVELTPRRSMILAELNRQRDTGHHIGLPGLRVVETIKVTK